MLNLTKEELIRTRNHAGDLLRMVNLTGVRAQELYLGLNDAITMYKLLVWIYEQPLDITLKKSREIKRKIKELRRAK